MNTSHLESNEFHEKEQIKTWHHVTTCANVDWGRGICCADGC